MRQLKISTSITQRSSDSVNKYITDISHIDMVDPREEALLCERIKKGDRAALTKLLCGKIGLNAGHNGWRRLETQSSFQTSPLSWSIIGKIRDKGG